MVTIRKYYLGYSRVTIEIPLIKILTVAKQSTGTYVWCLIDTDRESYNVKFRLFEEDDNMSHLCLEGYEYLESIQENNTTFHVFREL